MVIKSLAKTGARARVDKTKLTLVGNTRLRRGLSCDDDHHA